LEYTHLTLEERTVIMIYVQKGQRVEATARAVGRSAATIRRELGRNPSPYDALDGVDDGGGDAGRFWRI